MRLVYKIVYPPLVNFIDKATELINVSIPSIYDIFKLSEGHFKIEISKERERIAILDNKEQYFSLRLDNETIEVLFYKITDEIWQNINEIVCKPFLSNFSIKKLLRIGFQFGEELEINDVPRLNVGKKLLPQFYNTFNNLGYDFSDYFLRTSFQKDDHFLNVIIANEDEEENEDRDETKGTAEKCVILFQFEFIGDNANDERLLNINYMLEIYRDIYQKFQKDINLFTIEDAPEGT
jgi:hypothetical protein